MKRRLLLCTDMDRTLLPNGTAPEQPGVRKLFAEAVSSLEIRLAYVTGRDLSLVQKAIKNYSLPMPAFAITDVGTRIYFVDQGLWQDWPVWDRYIDQDWHGVSHGQLRDLFRDIAVLKLQETAKQSRHKLSYYVPRYVDCVALFAEMEQRLTDIGVQASLTWSIDDLTQVGLLDVLPRRASKLHAITFLCEHLGLDHDEVVFAGDSGNDMAVLCSNIPAVLVANATEEIKQQASVEAQSHGHAAQLYQAHGAHLGMNGNYSAGILEGVFHFCPELRDGLTALCADTAVVPHG